MSLMPKYLSEYLIFTWDVHKGNTRLSNRNAIRLDLEIMQLD